MADFAPNYTPRYRVRYTVLGKQHRVMFRVPRGTATPVAVAAKVDAFLAALAPVLFSDFAVLGADYAAEDSDVFLPAIAPSTPAGGFPAPGANSGAVPNALSFPGRTVEGLRGIFYIYGMGLDPNNSPDAWANFRVNPGENNAVTAAINQINGAGQQLVGNDDANIVFYPYANIKPNNHWIKRVRQ